MVKLTGRKEIIKNTIKEDLKIVKPIKTPKKKKFDLTHAVTLKSVLTRVAKQYWNKSPDLVKDIDALEKYLTEFTGVEFNFVAWRKEQQSNQ